MVKKIIPSLFASLLILMAPPLYALSEADPVLDLGLNMGIWTPIDTTVDGTFNSDFYLQGHFGVFDPLSNWGIRGNWGRFGADSHHPDDIGRNLNLAVVPLTLSIIYNTGGSKSGILQPYVGAGAGAYFYKVRDDIFGTLEEGTRFGLHVLAGLRMPLTDQFYLNVEYTYHAVPKVFFDNSDNFNSHVITAGFGYLFNIDGPSNSYASDTHSTNTVTYDSLEEQAKVLKEEIQEMKAKRKEMEASIELFYTNSQFYTSISLLKAIDQNQQLLGGKLIVLDTDQKKPLIEGDIISVETKGAETLISLSQNDWTTVITLRRAPFSIRVRNKPVAGITAANADDLLRVDTIADEGAFAQEARKVDFYNERVKELNKNIAEAQTELRKINEMLEARKTQRIQDNRVGRTTIVHYNEEPYFRRRSPVYQSEFQSYYYYNPSYYTPPIIVNPQPGPAVTPQDRQEYLNRKKEYIKDIKSR